MPAHYEVVAGVRLPARLSGHAALDFCNTWSGWDGNRPSDYLTSYHDLAIWSGFADLLSDEQVSALLVTADSPAAADVLDRARQFRASLYRVITTAGDAASLDTFEAQVHAAAAAAYLRPGDGGNFRWEVRADPGDPALPLLAVAWAAGQLLSAPDRVVIRACPGHGCGWLFIDARGRRRWCTMAICGNREKARRFTARPQGLAAGVERGIPGDRPK
jgi:predicted RNA-binding Zn ribbon-like protein